MEISTPGTDGTDSEMLCAKLYDGISNSRWAICGYLTL